MHTCLLLASLFVHMQIRIYVDVCLSVPVFVLLVYGMLIYLCSCVSICVYV